MKVILCTHNSGGVGKTTLAVHLAGVLSKRGDVLLIDCDDQADSWKFYVGEEPNEESDSNSVSVDTRPGISVITNPNRKRLKKFVKIEKYDYVVLDMNTPLANIVQVILSSDPHIIFIPISSSQRYKGLNNLEPTLNIIFEMETKATFTPEVFVVPLGISADEVQEQVNSIEDKPSQCSVALEMINVQDPMQEAVYLTKKYIWEYSEYQELEKYFEDLLINI
jgi:chromosome partitioning protein